MSKTSSSAIGGRLAVGALAGAIGTVAMDLLLYSRYRQDGGKDGVWRWEFAEGVTTWDEASAPGRVGQKFERLVIRRPPPDRWARATTNLMHWVTGAGWGLQYAALTMRTPKHRWLPAIALGPAVWATGYVVLPAVGVYQPIWKYDARTLGKDLSAHLLYGATTSAAFAALSR